MKSGQQMVKPVFRASVYKVIVVATALFSLLSFANAEQFTLSALEEVTHYAADDDFIGCRSVQDDNTDVSHHAVRVHVPAAQASPVSATVPAIVSPCYTLHDIRGPPAIAVIP